MGRGAGQDRPRGAPRDLRRAPGLPRARGARRRAALLRLGRLDAAASCTCWRRPATARWPPSSSPTWRAAGDWLLGALERGGGLLRWHRRAPGGLVQQGWRDSVDPYGSPSQGSGILHEDGSAPEPPVADADTQAAALAGLRALARLSGDGGPRGGRRGPGGAHRRGVGPRHDGARRPRPARARRGLAAGLAAVGRGAGRPAPPSASPSPTCSPTSGCARCRTAIRSSTRSPTTAARSGRSTRGWAGAGCAPPGTREAAERVRAGRARGRRADRALPRALRGHRRRPRGRRRCRTSCRRGRSAPCGRCATSGTEARMWWRDGVLYQVYPRSFADSDGDGIGDLRGITAHLDHLEWLGVDGLWLNPTFPSPNADWGFDVSDYRGVHPELGTLEDLDELVARAGERGIQVLLDLVPNHTSDQHPWFRERRDFYVWREGRNGEPPNNWKSTFGGPAWTRDEASGLWYLHNFTPEQPDLDWWNEDVRDEFDDILRFWMDRGHRGLPHRRRARDRQGPRAARQPARHRRRHRARPLAGPAPGVLDEPRRGPRRLPPLARRWPTRTTACSWARRGCSTSSASCASTATTSTSCTWPSTSSSCSPTSRPTQLAPIVAETEALLPEHAWPVWTLGNHDMDALPDALGARRPGARALRAHAAADAARARPSSTTATSSRCPTPRSRPSAWSIPSACSTTPSVPGRDGARSPMPWSDEPGAGFTRARRRALAALRRARRGQRRRPARRPGSPLNLTRDLIALRRAEEDLRTGAYEEVAVDDGLWAYRRGDGFLVALNLGADAASLAGRGHDRDRHPPPARRRGDRGVAAAGARRGRRRAAGIAADYGGVRGRGRCTRPGIEGKEAGGRRGACGWRGAHAGVRDSSDSGRRVATSACGG